jgi:protein-disulfide isomerase
VIFPYQEKELYMSFQAKILKSKSLAATFVGVAGLIAIVACTDQSAKAKPNLVVKDPPRPGVVAKINGEEITEEQLIGDDKLDFFDLKKREYDLKMERLNKLMEEKFIGADAKKAGMSTQDYINKKLTGGDIKISDKDYKKFVAEKHIPEAQINEQVKERINSYLKEMKKQEIVQNYIAKETKSNPVEVYFAKPKMQVQVDPGNAPMWGNKDAKVTVVEFSDFQCPVCSRAAETVTELKKKYNGKMKLYFVQFPLPMHKDARGAAEASLCVNDQGTDKFWKFHDLNFKAQDKLDAANLEKNAKDAGADVAKFKDCVASKKFADQVQKDIEYGEKVGVRSTPTFFVDGQLVSGAVPIENFSEIIDDDLAAK